MTCRRAALVLACLVGVGCTATLAYPAPALEDCFDGVDDDLDGAADLQDDDCQVGRACDGDAACGASTLVCSTFDHTCLPSCAPDRPCPNHWGCERGTCRCTPCEEVCNDQDDDCDGRVDEAGCAVGEACVAGRCDCPAPSHLVRVPSRLDLLFVLDNSGSMSEERDAMRAALPTATAVLATGDLDGDGLQDVAPVESLHVAVVLADLGSDVPSSFCTAHGSDGVLSQGTSCPGTPVFFYEAYRDSPTTLASALDCAFNAEPTRCGWTRTLDAALLALSPPEATAWTSIDYVPMSFGDGTSGHGSDQNAAFSRPETTLAVVVVSDGDDCSSGDPSVYDPAAPQFTGGNLTTRCARYPDALRPISEVVDHLLSLRSTPQNVFFAVVAGVPLGSEDLSPATVLADPRMQVSFDPSDAALVPSCASASGLADPPVRLVQAADGVRCGGGGYALASICDTNFSGTFRRILEAVASAPDRRACVR